MSEPLYDLFFSGEIMGDKDPKEVRSNLARMFKAKDSLLNQLFSGNPVKIKSGVDQDTAIKYRVAFRNAGALMDIKPSAEAGVAEAFSPAATEEMTLLPPRTGSLADCAIEKQPADLPDISNINLAPAGGEFDQTPRPTAEIPDVSGIDLAPVGSDLDQVPLATVADIDTSELTLNPANSGSLEDCHIEPEPAIIPDISKLKLDGSDNN